jgi:GWxTD domain-containing protein
MEAEKFNYKSHKTQKLRSLLSFQKISISFISLVLFLPFLLCSFGTTSSLSFSYQRREKLKEWLNGPVGYIITENEKKEFKKLALIEEKQKFIIWFWARRDPNSDTDWSEFQEEFYRRVDYANENFMEKGLEGWETARGMIFIILGPPEKKWEELIPGRGSRPAIFWLYDQFPSVLLDPMEPLVFFDKYRNGHYYLIFPDIRERLTSSYRRIIIRHRRFDLIPREFYHVFKEANEKAIKNIDLKFDDFLVEDIQKNIAELPAIPFQWKVDFEAITAKKIKLNIQITINYRDISYYQMDSTYNATLGLFIRLLQDNDYIHDEFQDEIKVSLTEDELKAKANEKLQYDCSFNAPPGEYYIEIELKDMKTGIGNIIKEKLIVGEQRDRK